MKLGTNIPQDEPAQVNVALSLGKSLGCLAEAGIRGCMVNFPAEEPRWDTFTLELVRASRSAGVEVLEYNPPFQVQVLSREQCEPCARRFVRMMELCENIGCLELCAGSAGPNNVFPHPWNRSRECHDLLKETCEIIAAESARRGLKARLSLEPIYTTLLWSPRVLAEFVDKIDSPNVQAHMDIVNCLNFDNVFDHADFIVDSFAVLGSRIHSAHLKDVAPIQAWSAGISECLVGDGVLDLRTHLDCLSQMPPGFSALIEHMSKMADIESSYSRVKALADEMGIPIWAE